MVKKPTKKRKGNYDSFLRSLRDNIVRSKFNVCKTANKEYLMLYLSLGKMLSAKIRAEKWGTKMLEKISADLQKELPGLKGFSPANLKKMRIFADAYSEFRRQISSTASNQLTKAEFEQYFFGISFSHHFAILTKVKKWSERLFYLKAAAMNCWQLSVLEHHLSSQLHIFQGNLPNNFDTTIPDKLRLSALEVFRDEYAFNIITDADTEEAIEKEILLNIRNVIMHMGKNFAFVGNQYRIEIGGDEFFIDLLFYNRALQCLVAFDLKRGKFNPRDAGQLNFYLNVLDEKMKLPHENPAIGIILCKEKNNTVVEFSIKSIDKAMGVATYRTTRSLPKEIQAFLPPVKDLKEIISK